MINTKNYFKSKKCSISLKDVILPEKTKKLICKTTQEWGESVIDKTVGPARFYSIIFGLKPNGLVSCVIKISSFGGSYIQLAETDKTVLDAYETCLRSFKLESIN